MNLKKLFSNLNFISKEKPDLTIVIAASPAREFKENSLLIEGNIDVLKEMKEYIRKIRRSCGYEKYKKILNEFN